MLVDLEFLKLCAMLVTLIPIVDSQNSWHQMYGAVPLIGVCRGSFVLWAVLPTMYARIVGIAAGGLPEAPNTLVSSLKPSRMPTGILTEMGEASIPYQDCLYRRCISTQPFQLHREP
jgi:hypothetical protein